MSRAKKRRSPHKASSEVKTVLAGPVDHTLRTLMVNLMALPPGSVRLFPDGRVQVTDDAQLYVQAIGARAQATGGRAAVEAALLSMLPAGKRLVCVEVGQ